MKTNYERVREFTELMKQPLDVPFEESLLEFRKSLVSEETYEMLLEADILINEGCNGEHSHNAKVNLLKELTDILYVVYGFAAAFGIDIDEAFKRVHESNMSKLVDGKPIKNEHGKVMKGPNYKKPVLVDLIPSP